MDWVRLWMDISLRWRYLDKPFLCLNCSNTWGQKESFSGEDFLTSWQVVDYFALIHLFVINLTNRIKSRRNCKGNSSSSSHRSAHLCLTWHPDRPTLLCARSILNPPCSRTIQCCLQTYSAAERNNTPHTLCWNRMKCAVGKAMVFFSMGTEGCTGSKRPLWQKVNGCTRVSLTITMCLSKQNPTIQLNH